MIDSLAGLLDALAREHFLALDTILDLFDQSLGGPGANINVAGNAKCSKDLRSFVVPQALGHSQPALDFKHFTVVLVGHSQPSYFQCHCAFNTAIKIYDKSITFDTIYFYQPNKMPTRGFLAGF